MTDPSPLFTEARFGEIAAPNRCFMAPLTRNRARPDGVPDPLAEIYYHQRASAGLIISEATRISEMATGYINTPGIFTEAQAAGWKKVTDAIHAGGGRIFCQIWHVGRISHSSMLPGECSPVSASDVQANMNAFTKDGPKPCSKPEPLSKEGIKTTVADFAKGAELSKKAGFDGVEIHAANGYLIDQFLQDGTNKRDDEYGGSIENRLRFLNEVIDAVLPIWGKDRVGVRLSPLGQANDMSDSDPETLFAAAYKLIEERQLAYLHVVSQFPGKEQSDEQGAMMKRLRQEYTGFFIENGGYDGDSAAEAVTSGQADAVAFGRPFLANPDLPERIRRGAALNEPDMATFYGGGAKGYIDYPYLDLAGPETA